MGHRYSVWIVGAQDERAALGILKREGMSIASNPGWRREFIPSSHDNGGRTLILTCVGEPEDDVPIVDTYYAINIMGTIIIGVEFR